MLNINIKNILRKPTNSRFHYTPRFYKGVEKENIYQFKSKYRKDEIEKNYNDFRAHWTEDRKLMRTRKNVEINTRLIIIAFILFLIVFYLLDFDTELFMNMFKFKFN